METSLSFFLIVFFFSCFFFFFLLFSSSFLYCTSVFLSAPSTPLPFLSIFFTQSFPFLLFIRSVLLFVSYCSFYLSFLFSFQVFISLCLSPFFHFLLLFLFLFSISFKFALIFYLFTLVFFFYITLTHLEQYIKVSTFKKEAKKVTGERARRK